MTSASDSTGSGSYSYDTAGLLTNRTVGNRMTSITSRDGEGRPLSITTTVNTLSQLTESLTWSGDGLLATHTLARADFTDPHVYTYANSSRRLVQEQLNLNACTTWTNTMVYDNGVAGGPGVLTQMGQANSASNEWSGVADAFSRVATETNSTFQYPAYGHVNGQSIFLSAWLDNQPVSITGVGTNAMQWRAMMELAPGAHQLKVSALHPSGYFTAWATNSFTNNLAYQTTADTYDSAGNITIRVWKNPNGTVKRTQTLSWDARGRLHKVSERDGSNSGYDWTATYDGLNRRLSTASISISNGVTLNLQPRNHQPVLRSAGRILGTRRFLWPANCVETLRPGLEWQIWRTEWHGRFGWRVAVSEFVLSDHQRFPGQRFGGNNQWRGVVDSGKANGYGAVPGYRPVALTYGADMAQSSAWRGRWVDITGYHQIGLRPYDSISGRWLTYDSVWNERDPNYYTFCGGDPVNGFDPDGKCVENTPPDLYFGNAPVMQTRLETTTYFENGSSATTGLPGQPDIMYDPSQVAGNSYNRVTQPTGEYFSYISENSLPDNYGQATSEPVNKFEVEQQQNLQGLKIMAVGLLYLDGTGEFIDAAGLKLLSTEGTAYSAIGSTGKIGENYLQTLGGESQAYFNTSQGARYVDQLVGDIANESKVGYQSLTPSISLQISKDAELLNARTFQGVNWHFFQSPVTGLGGPSQPLLNALQQNGINVIIH